MSKISLKELNKQLKESEIGLDTDAIELTPYWGVYHFHEWDHGYETIYGFNGSRREFYADMREMLEFLIAYFNTMCIKEIVIAPFHRYNQFDQRYYRSIKMPGTDIFDEIRQFLKVHGVRKGERTGIGIPVESNAHILEMIIEGSFRAVSQFCLFSYEHKILIEANHHFNLIFRTHEFEKARRIACDLLPSYPNLRYFDKYTT